MPRYLPVQLDSANDEIRNAYSRVQKDLGVVPNFLKTLAHSGNFLGAMTDLYCTLLGETALSEKLRSLVILKTCKLNKCKSTVDHFSQVAEEAGWTTVQVEAMEDYADSDHFSFYEKDILRLAELVSREPDEIQDVFWTQLDNHFTSDQVVELITLIGFFNMLNRFILALQIEPDKKLLPQKG